MVRVVGVGVSSVLAPAPFASSVARTGPLRPPKEDPKGYPRGHRQSERSCAPRPRCGRRWLVQSAEGGGPVPHLHGASDPGKSLTVFFCSGGRSILRKTLALISRRQASEKRVVWTDSCGKEVYFLLCALRDVEICRPWLRRQSSE